MNSARLRNTDVVVNLGALRHNIRAQKDALPAGSHIFGVVKADAYGNGMPQVARVLSEEGVAGFCVALLDEGITLRDQGLQETVLVLGITPVQYAPLAAENNISLTVGSVDWLKQYQQVAKTNHVQQPLKVHLGLDTGMGRIGFQDVAQFKQAIELLKAPEFDFEGIFTHFATADSADHAYFDRQLAKWKEFLTVVDERPRYVHMANSATGLWHQKDIESNTVRMGISLYGCNPSGHDLTPTFDLQPVTSLVTHATFVKELHQGESVSYGATYTAQQDEWVATLPVGYADGYRRGLTGYHVLIDGQVCDILGRICMDQMMVRLPHEMPVGTEAVLLGRSGNQKITATDLADQLGTINYEVLTGFGDRLHRRYLDCQ
ncbi:alanine racemase [uncultured Limosilactobacillus sp.]|uniref:alanine racemase n=1 Tax=uncultured Limosilactobacillus sp. TaxID=2837629 RepID=UPI0025E94777|nr:alanine racemase [uncultured Limosilactobacillus sp.]